MSSEVVPIKEVHPSPVRANECPKGCKNKFGEPRIMKKLVNAGPRVKRLPDGTTKQITVQITKLVCDRCGEQISSEQEM